MFRVRGPEFIKVGATVIGCESKSRKQESSSGRGTKGIAKKERRSRRRGHACWHELPPDRLLHAGLLVITYRSALDPLVYRSPLSDRSFPPIFCFSLRTDFSRAPLHNRVDSHLLRSLRDRSLFTLDMSCVLWLTSW